MEAITDLRLTVPVGGVGGDGVWGGMWIAQKTAGQKNARCLPGIFACLLWKKEFSEKVSVKPFLENLNMEHYGHWKNTILNYLDRS